MNKHRFDDVVTNDIMFLKVSRRAVARVGTALFSISYITFINRRNNVTTSLANKHRPFVGDIMVTLSVLCHSHTFNLSHSGFNFQFSGF